MSMSMFRTRFVHGGAASLFFAIICVGGAGIVFAHTTGAYWHQADGKYLVDVGYDPSTFQAGIYTRFDFNILHASDSSNADFAEVWVRILKSDTKDTLLATGIRHEPIGPTTLLYEFLQPGEYLFDASFRDGNGDEIVDAQFPITVAPADGSLFVFTAWILCAFVCGGTVGVAGILLWKRFRRARSLLRRPVRDMRAHFRDQIDDGIQG
jgi:hypothetical protein